MPFSGDGIENTYHTLLIFLSSCTQDANLLIYCNNNVCKWHIAAGEYLRMINLLTKIWHLIRNSIWLNTILHKLPAGIGVVAKSSANAERFRILSFYPFELLSFFPFVLLRSRFPREQTHEAERTWLILYRTRIKVITEPREYESISSGFPLSFVVKERGKDVIQTNRLKSVLWGAQHEAAKSVALENVECQIVTAI